MSVRETRHRADEIRAVPTRSVVGAVRSDAAADRVPLIAAWSVAGIPLVGSVVLGGLYLVAKDAFFTVLKEDQLVEWGQFALLLLCMLLAGAGAVSAFRDRRLVACALLGVAAVAFLGLAGEEISWAQRVFALVTPESLASVNQQAELNLHNINSGGLRLQDAFKVASALVGLAGVVMAFAPHLGRPWARLRTPLGQLLTVPRYALPGFAMMALYWPVHLTVLQMAPMSRFQEWVELSFYLSVTATLAVILGRLRTGLTTTTGTAVAVEAPTGSRRFIVAAAALVVTVTTVFAILTAIHGIIPLNAR